MAPSNYDAIGAENRTRYGTDIGRIGPMLLADRYDDRTHFIFELLQNAEDALGRRGDAGGPRSVTFALTPRRLSLSHFGRPFDEADVRGICGIAESTKDHRSIGRFGIGFKSVYTFTDRPEIHSGDEDFSVENYVQPRAASRLSRELGETQIILPLKSEDASAEREIAAAFQHLGPSALLFLRHIDEINWSIKGGSSGVYLRSAPASLGPNVKRVSVIGQETGKPEVDQNWLVFHSDVRSITDEKVGRVEIAFSLTSGKAAPERWSLQQLAASPLVVFFPTVVSTNLGFLVQGPYRTTPSRDNVPRDDRWNQQLVHETADLLVEALRWLRDNGMLDTSALRCLPTDRARFPEGAMFAPFFEVVRQAFFKERLLCRFDGGFVSARKARLARTQELRDLFSAEQIEVLFGAKGCAWLTGDITQDKAPELRKYLLQELQVPEITPSMIVVKLEKTFLEAQSDEWVTRLYAFLNGQKAIAGHFSALPLVRLQNGTHVVARENGSAKAFIPGEIETSFPTVRRAVCGTPEARDFLGSLGLTVPDPVDEVMWNVLPKYRADKVDVDDAAYATDIERICAAFNTDSKARREQLLDALRETPFVIVVGAGDMIRSFSKPGDVYIATDRLKALFSGVPGVHIVDDRYDCLRGEAVRDLLVNCGASRFLARKATAPVLSSAEKTQMRKSAGLERAKWEHEPEDFTIRGLNEVLEVLGALEPKEARARAEVLWDALRDLEGRGSGAFYGSYRWGYSYETKFAQFDAAFVRELKRASWVPEATGELVRPELVTFQSLGWKTNPFLLDRITFKPPIIDQLAKEAGIDPAALDLLRKHGITSVAELANRLGIVSKSAISSQGEAEPDDDTAYGGEVPPAAEVEADDLDETAGDDHSLAGASPSEASNEPDLGETDGGRERDRTKDTEVSLGSGNLTNGTHSARATADEAQRAKGQLRPGRRNLTGQSGLEEQAMRLGRRVASFFDGAEPDVDDEDTTTTTSTGWQTRLVCLEVAAGGPHLEVGPLEGLPMFVKKLRVVGTEWDYFVLAANAKARPTRVPVRPGTGPWHWEAVGFEEEHNLGLDRLDHEALRVTGAIVFRVDADGVGQLIQSTTLSPGQAYQLLLPPSIGDGLGIELDGGWRIWSLDLGAPLSPNTRQMLFDVGLDVGEAWPRLEWALAPASAWRTNARGESYATFESGTELFVNVGGLSADEGDESVLFLHGPSGTERLPLSASGLVSLGVPPAGRWACALMHSRTSVQPSGLVFEIARNPAEYVSAAWTVRAPQGLASLEATAPPGWPISLRWSVIDSQSLATLYGNDDRTVFVEGIIPLLEARAARAPVADLVFDLAELGRRMLPHDGRASLKQAREQLTALWRQRSALVQCRKGAWLQLMPTWFEPATIRFGYGIEAFALSTDVAAQHELAAWLLTIDERLAGDITRSPSRILVLTTDIDAVLRDCREWVDSACAAARVRDAIVTDGTRWTTHRKGDRQLRRREWNLDQAIGLGSVDDMLTDLTEGL